MKRTASILLCLLMACTLVLTGCNSGDGSDALASFVEEAQGEIAAMQDALGDTMEIAVTSEGTALIYTFTFKEDTGVDNETMREGLETGIEAQSAVYDSILTEMKNAKIKDPTIIIRYLDMNNDEIYVKEFS